MKKLVFILLIFFCYNTSDAIQRKGRQLGADSNTVLLIYFNAGTGPTAYDVSGTGSHGDVNAAWVDDGLWDGCLEFDGSTNYVLANADGITNETNAGSASAWVYYNTIGTGGDDYVMGSRTSGGERFYLSYSYLGTHWLGLGGVAPDTGVALSSGTWMQIVLEWDNGDYWWYKNAVLRSSGTYTSAPNFGSKIGIGCYDNNDVVSAGYIDGLIETSYIKNKPIGIARIKHNYQSQSGAYQ